MGGVGFGEIYDTDSASLYFFSSLDVRYPTFFVELIHTTNQLYTAFHLHPRMSNISSEYKGPIGQIRRNVGIRHMLSAPASSLKRG